MIGMIPIYYAFLLCNGQSIDQYVVTEVWVVLSRAPDLFQCSGRQPAPTAPVSSLCQCGTAHPNLAVLP